MYMYMYVCICMFISYHTHTPVLRGLPALAADAVGHAQGPQGLEEAAVLGSSGDVLYN